MKSLTLCKLEFKLLLKLLVFFLLIARLMAGDKNEKT